MDKWNIHVLVQHPTYGRSEGSLCEKPEYNSKEEAERDIEVLYTQATFEGMVLWNGTSDYRTRVRLGKSFLDHSIISFYPRPEFKG